MLLPPGVFMGDCYQVATIYEANELDAQAKANESSRMALTSLPGPVRRARMVEMIAEREFMRVTDLSDAFRVSEVTVRSDLDRMGEQVHRVRGGVIPRPSFIREPTVEESLQASYEAKMRIGRTAAAMVNSGMAIMLDVGSTTTAVARALVERAELDAVTIVTNSISIALELEPASNRFHVVVTGGMLRPRQHSLVGSFATVIFEQVHANIAFIGCNGIDVTRGITNVNTAESEIKQKMIASCDHVTVVATGDKIGQVHFARVAALEEIDTLITTTAEEGELEKLEAAGVHVVKAPETGVPRT